MAKGVFFLGILSVTLLLASCEQLVTAPTDVAPSVSESFDLEPPGDPSVGGALYLAIDTDLPPIMNWSSGGNGGTGVFRWRINGGPWTTTVTPPPLYLNEVDSLGEYRFEVQERDIAGNWSASASTTFRIVIDLPPAPLVTAEAIVDGTPTAIFSGTPVNDTTPDWDWTDVGTDDVLANWRYSFDQSNWTETTVQDYTPAPLEDGTYTLYVQQEQVLGGWTAAGSHVVQIDTVPPPIPDIFFRTTGGSYIQETGEVITHSNFLEFQMRSVLGGGGSGVTDWEYGGGDLNPGVLAGTDVTLAGLSELPTLSGLSAGERDAAGNTSFGPTGVRVAQDIGAPTVSGPSVTADQTPTWSWTNTTAGEGSYRVLIGGGPVGFAGIDTVVTGTSFTPSADLPTGEATPYTVTVRAIDKYGYESFDGILFGGTEVVPGGDLDISITLDEPEDLVINLTGDTSVDRTTGTFNASVAPAFTVESYNWYVDGVSRGTDNDISFTPASLDPPLLAGTYRLQLFYTVLDAADNPQLYSAELYFDVTN